MLQNSDDLSISFCFHFTDFVSQLIALRGTHDIAEELQMKLESLPDVERAYVHVDYETDHAPEHFLKKEL